MLISMSSNRSPAASRTQPTFSAVAARVRLPGSTIAPGRIRGARPTIWAALQDCDRLAQPGLTHRGRVEGHSDRGVLGLVPAGPDRDLEPAFGQDVQAGEVLGQDRRMAKIVVQHERRHPQPGRGRGDRGQGGDRRELADQVIRDNQDIDADRLGSAGRFGQFFPRGDRACLGQEAERTHPIIVLFQSDPLPTSGLSPLQQEGSIGR